MNKLSFYITLIFITFISSNVYGGKLFDTLTSLKKVIDKARNEETNENGKKVEFGNPKYKGNISKKILWNFRLGILWETIAACETFACHLSLVNFGLQDIWLCSPPPPREI